MKVMRNGISCPVKIEKLPFAAIRLFVVALLVSLACVGTAVASPNYLVWNRVAGETALDTMELAILNSEYGFIDDTSWLVADGGSVGLDEVGYHADCVVLVTNETWHDAAAAQALAGMDEAAVLETNPHELSPQTARVINRLHPSRIVAVGGPLAIDDAVLSAAAAATASDVERIWGQDAAGTALACYKARSGWGKTAFVATSGTWQDAVSAGPYAYAGKNPTFLAGCDGVISEEVFSEIVAGGFDEVILIGGEVAIPVSEEVRLSEAGVNVSRFAGMDAVDTCARAIQWAIASGFVDIGRVVAVTSSDYHDASIAACCCGRNRSVLALVSNGGTQTALDMAMRYKSISESAWVRAGHEPSNVEDCAVWEYPALALGGTAAIPQDVFESFPTEYRSRW